MAFSEMDLKGWMKRPDEHSQAYRFECFSCEFYRWHIFGGLVIDGVKERRWHCVLIDDRKEPCKFEPSESKPVSGPETQAVEPRLPTHKIPKPDALDTSPSRNLPSTSRLDSPHLEKPILALPDLSKVESPRLRSKKRRRS
jgi:hypothetical protein